MPSDCRSCRCGWPAAALVTCSCAALPERATRSAPPTSWQRHERLISPTTVKGDAPDLEAAARQRAAPAPQPLPAADRRRGQDAGGPKQIGIVAGVSDNVYGIDLDTGAQLWKRHFDKTFEEPSGRRGAYCSVPAG